MVVEPGRGFVSGLLEKTRSLKSGKSGELVGEAGGAVTLGGETVFMR